MFFCKTYKSVSHKRAKIMIHDGTLWKKDHVKLFERAATARLKCAKMRGALPGISTGFTWRTNARLQRTVANKPSRSINRSIDRSISYSSPIEKSNVAKPPSTHRPIVFCSENLQIAERIRERLVCTRILMQIPLCTTQKAVKWRGSSATPKTPSLPFHPL